MLFQTWAFAAFFAAVYPVHLLLRGTRWGSVWLLATSYVFYAAFDPIYLVLISYSIVVDYGVLWAMSRWGRRRWWLAVSIVNNLGLLGFFKYGGFAVDNINAALTAMGASFELSCPTMLLPVGLSFYVFQSLGYVIDCYRGQIERERSLIRHAVFVSFFPRLLAGPIERARNLLPQLERTLRPTKDDVAEGLSLFVVGLFKKMALADFLALYVDKVYSAPGQFGRSALLAATFLFTWQIYFDFSGYTDMARGVARMMGIRLMVNFRRPYLAASLGEFWARWHISLSSWFKDYVYIPLGGNRAGASRTYLNMFITMVLSGLWHGAAWTFVLWGVIHAAGRFATRELERTAFYRERVPTIVKQGIVFAFVMLAWVFFRAGSIGDAWLVLTRIWRTPWDDPGCPLLAFVMIAGVWGYEYACESRLRAVFERPIVKVAMMTAMIVYLVLLVSPGRQPFIYLKF